MAVNSEFHSSGARMDAASVAAKLQKARRAGDGWTACCPAHEDRTPSLSITDSNKGVLVHCHAGCSQEAVLNALEAYGVQLRKPRTEADILHPLLDVASLSAAKGISADTLLANYVQDAPGGGVMFCYASADNSMVGAKYRKYLGGGADRGFSWSNGSKPCLYGLWRLEKDYANDGRIILCEGETDALTLWQHGYTALALPGASMWKEEWASCIPEGAKVYVIIEPDQGGRTVEAAIEKSSLRDRAYFIRMAEAAKDPNALHLQAASFVDEFDKLISEAKPAVTPTQPRIWLRTAAEIMADIKETDWLIDDILERRVSALMVGARGSLKSFVALHWLMQLAVEGKGVIALSAEGDGLGRRMTAWHNTFAPAVDTRDLKLVAFERSISLVLEDIRVELSQIIDKIGWAPEVMLIDTLSKYSAGLDENENSEVRDFLSALAESFTYKFGCSILLVGHTGYAASDRIRGASSFGANTEAEYIVTRQDPMQFICKVSRERFKDSPPLEPIAYQGEVIDLGREDKRGRRVTSLVMRSTDVPPPKVRGNGVNQTAMTVALREWGAANPGAEVIPSDELNALVKRQGINRKRKLEMIAWLVNAGALLPSIGGHKLNREALK